MMLQGLEGVPVTVEVSILPGLPAFELSGLGDTAVRESRNRVRAAIRNSGYRFPKGRVIASLAPAWLHKQGSAFDLALALAILLASGQISESPGKARLYVLGELGLDGSTLKPLGLFCQLVALAKQGADRVLVPSARFGSSMWLEKMKLYGVRTLGEACAVFQGFEQVELNQHEIVSDSNDTGSHFPTRLTLSGLLANRRRSGLRRSLLPVGILCFWLARPAAARRRWRWLSTVCCRIYRRKNGSLNRKFTASFAISKTIRYRIEVVRLFDLITP